MEFISVCIITDDVPRAVAFYTALLGTTADGDETHAFIHTKGAGLAIYNANAAREDMGLPVGEQGSRVTFSFVVEDVDALVERVTALSPRVINLPTDWPWGARSMQFLDPDGNVVILVRPSG